MKPFTPEDKSTPPLYLCPDCGAVLIPQVDTGKYKLCQIVEAPEATRHLLTI